MGNERDFMMFWTGTAQDDRLVGLSWLSLMILGLLAYLLAPPVWTLIKRMTIKLSAIALEHDKLMRDNELENLKWRKR